jgi:WD40 repeat protein
MTGHDRSVYSVSWGVGKGVKGEGSLGWVASTGGDGSIHVWELSVCFYLLFGTSLIFSPQEPPSADRTAPSHKLIALLHSAHGVHDVNTVSWCPREGFEDLLATSGDDGTARVWRIKHS